jgi:hypothetical protein
MYEAGGLDGRWKIPELLDRLQSLERYVAWATTRNDTKVCLISFCIAFASFAATFSSLFAEWFLAAAILGGIGVCSLVVSIYFFRISFTRSECDTAAVTILGPVMRSLKNDLKPDFPLGVTASLTPRTASAYQVYNSKPYETENYRDCVDSVFKRELLKVDCRLRDNSLIKVTIVDKTSQKVRTKTVGPGRSKRKRTNRISADINIQVLLDNSRCRLTGQPRLPKNSILNVQQQASETSIFVKLIRILNDKEQLTAKDILGPLAGIFSAVTMTSDEKAITTGGEA